MSTLTLKAASSRLCRSKDLDDDIAIGDHALEAIVLAEIGTEPTPSSANCLAASLTLSFSPTHLASGGAPE